MPLLWVPLQSTLMRSIASGKLDGFPPKEVLRTVYVEHDIDASQAETSVVDFVVNDKMLDGERASGCREPCWCSILNSRNDGGPRKPALLRAGSAPLRDPVI